MSKKLLVAQTRVLDIDKPDVKSWIEILKGLSSMGVDLVDRLDIIKLPYNFHNYFPMPTNLHGFNKSFTEVCVERAKEYLELNKKLKKPILVLWSGGIDSTTVLVSFILAGATRNELIVCLNNFSIQENFNFYYKFIRNRFDTITSEGICDYITGNYIMVGGEHNDQIFGTEILGKVYLHLGIDFLFQPANEVNVKKVFTMGNMYDESKNIWYDLLQNHSKHAPTEIRTIFDFFWWYNFSIKWQTVFFRILLRTNIQNRNVVNDEFVRNYYHQFFVGENIQKWAILNPDKKIGKTWQSYKLAAKELIYDFDKNKDYFSYKVKYGSLSRVFRHRQLAQGLTSDYEFIDNLNPLDFYNSNNSFR